MRVSKVALQGFRNVAMSSLCLQGNRQFLIGSNGQGKTNLLEAVGLLTALRSFRTVDAKQLVGHGCPEATLVYALLHERMGETEVTMKIGSTGREVIMDGNKVRRLADFIGLFPTVVLSSQDLQLVRGSPAIRRRFLDMILSATDAEYLVALQSFHRALESRNKLLRQGVADDQLSAFEQPMAEAASLLVQKRASSLLDVGNSTAVSYAALSGAAEEISFGYRPNVDAAAPEGFRAILESQRKRDVILKTTQSGPHKDDFEMLITGRPLKDFASEGQQRSAVIALRLAQVEFFQSRLRVAPTILADDVLGELDPERRARFWAAVNPTLQVIATGTEFPEGESATAWQLFRVTKGTFVEIEP